MASKNRHYAPQYNVYIIIITIADTTTTTNVIIIFKNFSSIDSKG